MQQPANYTTLDNYRFERKFVGKKTDLRKTALLLKAHPECFRETYASRQVNNIYLDTPLLQYYADNHHGKDNRVKFRIRWYGALNGRANQPILEIKIKKGLVGIKRSYPLQPLEIDETLDRERMLRIAAQSDLPDEVMEQLKRLEPVLVNCYSRSYYESFNRKFRITLDSDLQYFHFNRRISWENRKTEPDKFVLEMKYNSEFNDDASRVTQQLPFRLAKNSKYVSGVDFFYPGIAH